MIQLHCVREIYNFSKGRWERYLHDFSTIINYAAVDAAELADGIIALHERQTRLLKQALRQNQAAAAQALLHHLYEVSIVDKDSVFKLLGSLHERFASLTFLHSLPR